jgi:indolepyruvate ferredoxin oxidoreductase
LSDKQSRPNLDDRYTVESGRVFLTGTQALARLPMLQRDRDQAAGLNTAGFISGYRGSPLGGLDLALWKAREHLARHHVIFQPGVNEDLAATSIWGTQQVNLFPGAKYDGTFAMWYGKGPGVDRCGDVFKHANSAGTWKHGGVLAVAGDDHAARSSTVAHQSEHAFKAAMMPVLAPSSVQEYLDLGLHGWALSRYSGCWVAFKAVADTVESSASLDIAPDRVNIVIPTDYRLPPDGLNIRWPDPPLAQEARLLNHKLYAALAFCRANRLNRIVIDSPSPRLGIITCGKSYLDVRQALDDLGIDDQLAAEIGIRLYKIGMVWPVEADGVRKFAEGLEEILVVEEKRQFIEYQLKEELYNWREDVRPRVIGKFDEKGEWSLPHGNWLLPATAELSPAQIARVIADRIGRSFTSPRIEQRLELLEDKDHALATPVIPTQRTPFFCPGCPHNTSTKLPEGSTALAGIGCHYMAIWMNRSTATFSHMGGEGAACIGQAPFTERQHMFVNLGDGTYFHSGLLAIRAAVAAKVAVTY